MFDTRIFPITDYTAILDETWDKITALGDLKGAEYAGDVDRLANFRKGAFDLEVPYELIWRVYSNKHWDAITQYVKDVVNERDRPRLESLDGRVDDLIVYLVLFKCMLREAQTKADNAAQRAKPASGTSIASEGSMIDGH